MRRRRRIAQEVGVDLLLASSDAFAYVTEELAAEYARRYDAGETGDVLEWSRCMAEFAGWWCGRLEAEADRVVGFDSETGSRMNRTGQVAPEVQSGRRGSRTRGDNNVCRRGRRPGPTDPAS